MRWYIISVLQTVGADENLKNVDNFLEIIGLIKDRFVYNIGSQNCHKFFMVSFPYTSHEHLIPDLKNKLRTFQLMQDIGSLFMAIHGLPEGHSDQRTYGKGINDKDYVKCEEGLELCKAINNACCGDDTSVSSLPSECPTDSMEDIWMQNNAQFLS